MAGNPRAIQRRDDFEFSDFPGSSQRSCRRPSPELERAQKIEGFVPPLYAVRSFQNDGAL